MLYIVPTPIGNLDDITHRAVRILKEADIILAEDTRTTKVLLNHYRIEKKIFSHHAFNEHHTTPEIINMLNENKTIALVSDAGTPGISDPGFYLARECIKNKIKIECLPGATAFVPALINSGLPSDKFCFEGFLPTKKGRKTAINNLKDETRTMIFYESPFRLVKTLETFAGIFGSERKASVSRELTKIYEETQRGTLKELVTYFNPKKVKGEIVIVIAGKEQ